MGNLCIKDYNILHNHKSTYIKCIKCNDTVNIQKNNTRKHCRIHRINDNGICIDCYLNTNNSARLCHHIGKKTSLLQFLFK